jgi:hypothetical protein
MISPQFIFYLCLFTVVFFFVRSIIDTMVFVSIPVSYYYVKDLSIEHALPVFLLVCLVIQVVVLLKGVCGDSRKIDRVDT